jgi:hypothetical protein
MLASSTIKKAHAKTADVGTKTYRFILLDANQTESIVLFNDNGEELKKNVSNKKRGFRASFLYLIPYQIRSKDFPAEAVQ